LIPKKKEQLTFLLSQSVSAHFESDKKQESNLSAKWHIPPVMITRQNDVLGSIFFDEHSYGNDEVVLEFFTVNFQERNSKKFPQRPLS